MAGTARDEAERLVAAVLAMAGSAGARDKVTAGLGALGETVAGFLGGDQSSDGQSGTGQSSTGPSSAGQGSGGQSSGGQRTSQQSGHGAWATGSAECCVCPICRVIASMRDPSPETAVRLAAGAGDLATGVASLMRAFSAMAGERPRPKPAARPRTDNPEQAWSAATRSTPRAAESSTANRAADAWGAATNTAARASEVAESKSAAARGGEVAESKNATALGSEVVDSASAADRGAEGGAARVGGDSWSAATTVSAARAAAEHAAEVEAKAARRAAQQAAQREAAQAAARRAREAAERVAEAVRLASVARERGDGGGDAGVGAADAEAAGTGGGAGPDGAGVGSQKPGTAAAAGGARPGARTTRKLDVWAAATADAGVAAVGGAETLDHDGDGVAGDGARGDSV